MYRGTSNAATVVSGGLLPAEADVKGNWEHALATAASKIATLILIFMGRILRRTALQTQAYPTCAQALSSRFTLTGWGVRNSWAKKLTRSSSSNQRNSAMRSSTTPLRSATSRQ